MVKAIKLLILLSILISSTSWAAPIFVLPKATLLDDSGDICTSCEVEFYEVGTSTPKEVYSDSTLDTSAGSSLTSNSAGRIAVTYFDGAYKIIVKDSDGVTLYTADNLRGMGAYVLGFAMLSDYTSLSNAVSTISTTEVTLYIDTDDTMAADITVPSTLSLVATKGNVITLGAYALAINGPFEAGLFQMFNLNSTGELTFSDSSTSWVSPNWFGAIEGDSTDDQAAFQDAATTVYNSGGGLVSISAGDWNLDTKVSCLDGVNIQGSGWETRITIPCTVISEEAFEFRYSADSETVDNASISDLAIISNCTESGDDNTYAIDAYATNFRVENVYTYKVNIPIVLTETTDFVIKDCMFELSELDDDGASGYGVLLQDGSNGRMEGNTCLNCDRHCFYLHGDADADLATNMVVTGNTAIWEDPSSATNATYQAGVKLYEIDNVTISGNVFSGLKEGVWLIKDVYHLTITGNVMEEIIVGGIATNTAEASETISHVVITGNLIDAYASSTTMGGGIYSQADDPMTTDVIITGNIFRDWVLSNTTSAILLDADFDDLFISGNVYDNCGYARTFSDADKRITLGPEHISSVTNTNNTADGETARPNTIFTDEDTTPDVSGATQFITANTSATAIARFDDGYTGQRITVHVNDALTTFAHANPNVDGSIWCINGVDQYANSGDIFYFEMMRDRWKMYAVARGVRRGYNISIADSGDGNAATATLDPMGQEVIIYTCSDSDTCDITFNETNAVAGLKVFVTNTGANSVDFADSSGVQETRGGGTIALGQYDSVSFIYNGGRWVQAAYESNN